MSDIQQAVTTIRELEAKASKGPWVKIGDGALINSGQTSIAGTFFVHEDESACATNADLICSLRNNILPILDYVKELEAKAACMKKMLGWDGPYDLVRVLSKGVEAMSILLDHYDYTAHGWELMAAARAKGVERLANWDSDIEKLNTKP